MPAHIRKVSLALATGGVAYLLAVAPQVARAQNSPDWQLEELNSRLAAIERILAPIISGQERNQRDLETIKSELDALRGQLIARDTYQPEPAPLPEFDQAFTRPIDPATPTATASTDQVASYLATSRKDAKDGNWKAAQARLETFLAIEPEGSSASEARFWLGRAYHAQGRFPEAAALFLKGYQNGLPEHLILENLFYLASSLEDMGSQDSEQLCAIYDEAVAAIKDTSDKTIVSQLTEKRVAKGC